MSWDATNFTAYQTKPVQVLISIKFIKFNFQLNFNLIFTDVPRERG